MGNKIIIDEKDFNEKVIGWIERRTYVQSNDLIALLKDLITTISIDDSIEDRVKHYPFNVQLHVKQALIEHSIISEIKSKECNHDWGEMFGEFTCRKCHKKYY
jgi:hypothetical protein